MVEWKKLGEVCTIIRGNRVTKGELVDNGKFPVISGGVTPMGFIDSYNREPNTITVAQYGTAGYVDFQHSRFWANDICYCVYPEKDMDNKYLWYVLKGKQNLLYAIRNTDAVPYSLPIDTLKSVSIPIPSLSEQTRIVGILDTFTSAIDNLKGQIAQRRKQYEYYRDQLLDLEGKPGVEMKTLGEILILKKGEYITKKEAIEGIYPVILGGKEPAYFINRYNHVGKAIVISRSGASAGYVSFWNEPIFVTDGFLIEPHNNVTIEFLYYILKNKQRDLHGAQKGGAIPHITPTLIRAFIVAVPPLREQQRIVSILDTFEASIQNLEAQLKQREKQYEYYRNKLLSFE